MRPPSKAGSASAPEATQYGTPAPASAPLTDSDAPSAPVALQVGSETIYPNREPAPLICCMRWSGLSRTTGNGSR
jgi:hypothetical protein